MLDASAGHSNRLRRLPPVGPSRLKDVGAIARLFRLAALSSRLEQAHARCDRNVERTDTPLQRDTDDTIAKLARQTAQARTFSTKDPGQRTGQLGVEQVLAGLGVRPDEPYSALFQLAHRPCEIGHANDGYGIRGARSRIRERSVDG